MKSQTYMIMLDVDEPAGRLGLIQGDVIDVSNIAETVFIRVLGLQNTVDDFPLRHWNRLITKNSVSQPDIK